MWKKTFTGGVILGIISFIVFFCSRLIVNYNVDTHGIDFKTIETIVTVSAFSVSIAIGVIAISAFARFCLQKK